MEPEQTPTGGAAPRGEHLRVSDLHEICFDTRGRGGTPVVFLHGGPGAGVRDTDRMLFADHSGLAVFPDQRGAGRSRPSAAIEQNTTADLVADLESLREHLGIDRWVVFGGSWGSTLALHYAIAHPARVLALIVHGVFLCSQQEFRWFYGRDGAATIYPDEYERLLAPLEPSARGDVIAAYHDLLLRGAPDRRREAARAWARGEAVHSFLSPSSAQIADFTDADNAYTTALFETTYFRNGAWVEDDFLLKHAERIAEIPSRIVQGRYDTICPVRSAFELHRALPMSTLDLVTLAAHDSSEERLRARLRAAVADIGMPVGEP